MRWRVGLPVDAAGVTPEGEPFRNIDEYKRHLLAHPERFVHALTEKLLTYATGRGMGFWDRAEIDRLVKASAAQNHAFRELVHEIVQSELFRTK